MPELQSTAHVPIDERVFGRGVVGFARPHGTGARAALLLAVIVCCAIFGAGSRWMGIPQLEGFDGCLMSGPSPFATVTGVGLLLAFATMAGTVLAGAVRFEAGLFAATLGLAVVSLRCGTIQSVLRESSDGSHVYYILATELMLLAAILGILWAALWMLGKADFVRATPGQQPITKTPSTAHPAGNLAATMTQTLTTMLIVMFLCQSAAKNQALVSVAIGSTVGTLIAYTTFPVRPSIWFWVGPIAAGLIGYLLAAMGPIAGLATGNPEGLFAGLARPLPLDYASVGTAGAILGYWMVHRHPQDDASE